MQLFGSTLESVHNDSVRQDTQLSLEVAKMMINRKRSKFLLEERPARRSRDQRNNDHLN